MCQGLWATITQCWKEHRNHIGRECNPDLGKPAKAPRRIRHLSLTSWNIDTSQGKERRIEIDSNHQGRRIAYVKIMDQESEHCILKHLKRQAKVSKDSAKKCLY